MACCMVLFIFSPMSTVWSFAQIVPWNIGRKYENSTCSIRGIVGLSAECYNQTKIADVVIRSENQCTADECFDVQPANCIQIFVSTPGTYRSQLLHQDEVD